MPPPSPVDPTRPGDGTPSPLPAVARRPPPRRRADGFLERGGEVTRVEAFIDAAFAFALTLLVISFDRIPGSVDELVEALKSVPAFAASFALVAMFWHAHHRWSRRTGLDDGPSVLLGMLLVFLVLVWVYPLRMLNGAAFAWFVELLAPDAWRLPYGFRISSSDDLRTMYIVYALAWSSLGLVIAALYRRAWTVREALGLDREERIRVRGEIARWLWVPVTGLVSILLALALPFDRAHWSLGAPGFAYALMGGTGSVMRIAERRSRGSSSSSPPMRGGCPTGSGSPPRMT